MIFFGKAQKFSPFGKSGPPPRIEIKRTPPPAQKSQKATPQKPKTLFEEKKQWSRYELKRKIEKSKPYIPGTGGEIYSHPERKKMLDTIFPQKRFSSHISEQEAKTRLRELRKEESQAKTYGEKIKLNRLRQYLEGETGLKGKY